MESRYSGLGKMVYVNEVNYGKLFDAKRKAD